MKIIIIIFTFFISVNTFSQYSYSGMVTDENKTPIPFSNVSLKTDTKVYGATTDFDGFFIIKGIPAGNYALKVSYIGYVTKENTSFQINTNKTDTFQLFPSEQKLEEIVVIRNKIPLIDAGMTSSKQVITNTNTGNINVRGSRRTVAKNYKPLPDQAYIIENEEGFTNTVEENTSTFSIDVDNASYTLIRNSILKQKQIPAAENVRIEEMINYFDYNYAEPKNGETFSAITELGNCPWNTKAKLLHIGIQGKRIDYKNLDNSNLVFLIDVSGSMTYSLSLIQKSLNLLVDNLTEKDKISIVAYAGAAGEVLEATPASEKPKIKEAINNLKAGGSTAGGAGIQLAYKIAKKNFIKGGNNRVILCTDGDFNLGISTEEGLIKLIEEKRKEKVFLSVCGFGRALYSDKKMESLANKGNGNYYFIDSEKEAKKVFITQMGGTLFTIAKDFKIQMVFNEELVKSYRLIGYENRKLNNEDFKDDKKDAGELGAGQTVTALYEVILKDKTKEKDLATIKLRFKKPEAQKSKLFEYAITNKLIEENKTSRNFNFSATVASFGLLLSNTNTKNKVPVQELIARAKAAISEKDKASRNEFVAILEAYEKLNNK